MKLGVLDLETTGLDYKTDRIVEFGMVTYIDKVEIGCVQHLVRPWRTSCFVPQGAYRIHKISAAMLRADGVLWAGIAPDLIKRMEEVDVLCAQNHYFDIPFLNEAFSGVGLVIPDKPIIDTMLVGRRFLPDGSKSLDAMCKKFGIIRENSHRAVEDSRDTAKLLFRMCKELDINYEDLAEAKPMKLGKFHMSKKHVDPFDALYAGLPRRRYDK